MNDSRSLDNLSLTAGPTDLGEPKTKPIAPAPDDLPSATAAPSAGPETLPKSRCGDLGHSWIRDAKESGTGQPGHAARHYSCNRVGCGCTQTCAWSGNQWVATVTEPIDDNRKAPGV